MLEDNLVTIYSDGSVRPRNPGVGGWAAVMLYKDRRKELSGGFRLTTNNRMEMYGAVAALEALNRPCRVELFSDSQYLINAFLKRWVFNWERRGWRKASNFGEGEPVLNTDLWLRLLEQHRTHEITFNWVRGHFGVTENERCDHLAGIQSALPAVSHPIDEIYQALRKA